MQYSVLTSAEVLKVVSRKLNLAAEWGMTDEMAATNLADMIKVAPVRATDLVDVIVPVRTQTGAEYRQGGA